MSQDISPQHIWRPKKLTIDEIREGCIELTGNNETETRVCVINEEFRQGFDFIKKYQKTVTFFGSARLTEDHEAYQQAVTLAGMVARELGYGVVTGGGPGIMEAGNRGAFEAGGQALGLNIRLPMEQTSNPYQTDSLDFYFFFSRKVTMAYSAEAYIYFPGGFGTLDELFEILTLVQTDKIAHVPIILFGSAFWKPLDEYIRKILLAEYHTISEKDLDLYTITDSYDEALEIIRKAPIRLND